MKLAQSFYLKDDISKNDTKQLYRLIDKLTGVEKDNLMPNACSEQDLAECFADFFVDKIMKTWNKLDKYALYEPRLRDLLTTFNMFHPIMDIMVKKLVRSMESK